MIKTLFIENSIDYDSKDFCIVKVEPLLFSLGPNGKNSILFIAPIVTNSHLLPLRIDYRREKLENVLGPLQPSFWTYNMDTTISEVFNEINESLVGRLVLDKKDFYDTFIVDDGDRVFAQLHCKPECYYYTGFYEIELLAGKPEYVVSFDIVIEANDPPFGEMP